MRNILAAASALYLASCTTTESISTRGDLSIDSEFAGRDVEYKILVDDSCDMEAKKATVKSADGEYIITTAGDRISQDEVCEISYQKVHLNPFWYIGKTLYYAIMSPILLVAFVGALGEHGFK